MSWLYAAITLLWIAALAGAKRMENDRAQIVGPDAAAGAPPTGGDPEVSVIVPARNEEANVGALLESLLAQSHPPAEIVVVDDRSEDGTARVVDAIAARDPRVRRIASEGPEEGWTGKTAALTRGAASASSPWLLFVDADVRLHRDNLRAALRTAVRGGWDGLSLWGRWEVPSAAARMLQSVIGGFVRGAHPLPRVNDPSRPDAFLNGQYLLMRRGPYDELGGWAAVRDQVLEDVVFARRAKKRGIRIGMLRAPELMSVVPYRTLGEVWRGYLKNFVAGAGGSGKALLAALAIFVASVVPWLGLAWDLLTLPSPGVRIAAAGAACLAMVLYRAGTASLFHHPAVDALLHPVANAVFVALIVTAVARRQFGVRATWKGREVG